MSDSEAYLVILVRGDIDRFGNDQLFADELRPAIEALGVGCRIFDYRRQVSQVLASLGDPQCKGMICFNGYGSEIATARGGPGELRSAFTTFDKPLFDLMHDSPAHEAMGHQVEATFPHRVLLITDYDYAAIAKSLGVQNVIHVPSIGFPFASSTVGGQIRDIPILFALGLSDPRPWAQRIDAATVKGRFYRQVFEEAVDRAVVNWRLDPAFEVQAVLRDIGMPFDWRNPDCRFLISVTSDFVKFRRRELMLESLAGLPVTVVSDRPLDDPRFVVRPQVSARGLLGLMGRSEIVVCPTTHASGFHERPLSAMTAGAAVLSAPNSPLESHFMHGRDILLFSNAAELRTQAEILLEDTARRQEIAASAERRAASMFPPARIVETIVSAARSRLGRSLLD